MSFRDRVAQKTLERNVSASIANISTPTKGKTDAFEKSDFYGVEHVRDFPPCLELRFADGISRALPYSFILEICFNPSEGIEISTTMKKISVTGRNLKSLYLALVAYRVAYITENIGNDLTEENKLFVRKISMEES